MMSINQLIIIGIMRRIWSFKSWTNFAITTLGVSAIGLVYRSMTNQKNFTTSPIVTEGIKIAGMDSSIKQLLGYPLHYSASYSNSYHSVGDDCYYKFEVRGPRGHTTVELGATKKQVREFNEQKEKIAALSEELEAKKRKYDTFDKESKGSRKDKSVAANQKRELEVEIIKLKHQKQMEEKRYQSTIEKYYIPNEDLFAKVYKGKDPNQVVGEDEEVFAITALAMTLPNHSRISIIPPEEGKPGSQTSGHLVPKPEEPITEGYFKSRMTEGLENLSEAELESYSRHKTQAMYGKYNSYRVMMFFVSAIGAGLFFVYWHRHRLQPIGGTIIGKEAQLLFMNHYKVKEVLQKLHKNKNNVKWSQTFAGGRRHQEFRCSVDVEGVPGGKVHFAGEKEDSKKVKYSEFIFEYSEGAKVKKVNLLE